MIVRKGSSHPAVASSLLDAAARSFALLLLVLPLSSSWIGGRPYGVQGSSSHGVLWDFKDAMDKSEVVRITKDDADRGLFVDGSEGPAAGVADAREVRSQRTLRPWLANARIPTEEIQFLTPHHVRLLSGRMVVSNVVRPC